MNRTRQEKQFSFQNQRRKNYFEGWYFKQVSSDESVVLSIIPSMMRNQSEEKAMLQLVLAERIDGEWQLQTEQLVFPMSAFQHALDPFSLQLGNNVFTRDGISLDVNASNPANAAALRITGDLSFGTFLLPPATMLSPTIMGFFSYLPFMECIHAIGSLHHTLSGALQINDRTISFEGGIGYIEKDWGHSFPASYVWLQSNHFAQRPACLFFSWAEIPLGPLHFPGFICHLWINNQHHRFATYNRATCTIHAMDERHVSLTLNKRPFTLSIQATSDRRVILAAPRHGHMDHQIKEGLTGTVAFRLKNEQTGETIEDCSSLSGVEMVPHMLQTAKSTCKKSALPL